MPHGFFLPPLFPTRTVNSFGLDFNCYYVTVAALLGTTTRDLVGDTGLMQNITGTDEDIKELFRSAGINAQSHEFTHGRDLYNALSTLPEGACVGFAYTRIGQTTGHMVVVQRSPGSFPQSPTPGLRCLDFQKIPTAVLPFPPEPGIDRGWIYYEV